MEIKNISLSLKKCGIKKGDTIMVHGDAGIVAQLNIKTKKKIDYFFDEIIKYIGKQGTILVPTFTYASCKKKYFDCLKTPSELGLFSENFRNRKFTKRTNNPIFSFSIYGKKYRYFKKANIKTCFGKNSVFDFFHRVNGKIICLGCSIDRVTFTHHVEEFFGVDYRFHKTFNIIVKNGNMKKNIDINYYVRKLDRPSRIDLNIPYKILKRNKKIREINFGRYKFLSFSSKDFFQISLNSLKKNKYSLIRKN